MMKGRNTMKTTMKRFAVLISVFIFIASFAVADDLGELTQNWTYMHSRLMEALCKEIPAEDVFEHLIFLPMENHSYTGCYAYGTKDGTYTLVFTPNKTGTGILRVNLMREFNYTELIDFDIYQEFLNHVHGILLPWEVNDDEVHHAIADTDKYSDTYMRGAALGPNEHTEDLRVGNLAHLACYRSGESFGVAIDFNSAVTSSDLAAALLLLMTNIQ